MTKHRNLILGSLLLVILTGAILVLSQMKYGVAKSSPVTYPPTNEARDAPLPKAVDAGNESEAQEDIQASLENEWERFATTEFCFLGSDDYSPEREGKEMSFNPYGWLPSAKKNLDSAIAFLLERIPSKKRTKAHVCPLDQATQGELAIYSLQYILKKNWYELNDDYKSLYANKPKDITDQELLRSIIENKKKVHEMIDEWKKLYEENRSTIQGLNVE